MTPSRQLTVSRAGGAIGWDVVSSMEEAVAVYERPVFGTNGRVAVWPPDAGQVVLEAVDRELEALDRQVSRFRPDAELVLAERTLGAPTLLSAGAADALTVALAAAYVTDGHVDPTVGASLCALGYDRDFAAIDPSAMEDAEPLPAPGWRSVRLDGRVLRLPAGVRLDLGATAKGLGADRAASAGSDALVHRGGVLVSLGGDIAVAGVPPRGGWPIAVAEQPGAVAERSAALVRLARGGLATSSVAHRRWRQGGRLRHHVLDPSTGLPAAGPWRTVTVAARCCVEANTASTAALVAGEGAERWLESHALPARLVSHRGEVRLVGAWPGGPQGHVVAPRRSIFEPVERAGIR